MKKQFMSYNFMINCFEDFREDNNLPQATPLPLTLDVNWTYMRCIENAPDLFWTSYVRSIYVRYPEGVTIKIIEILIRIETFCCRVKQKKW